jgi:hypothetical protein
LQHLLPCENPVKINGKTLMKKVLASKLRQFVSVRGDMMNGRDERLLSYLPPSHPPPPPAPEWIWMSFQMELLTFTIEEYVGQERKLDVVIGGHTI